MARLDVLPSIDIIRGLKGTLDFYLWRGLPCVRAWPRYRPARQTDASLAAALLFGAVIKAFALTHAAVLEHLALEATGIPRTTRDIYVSGVYGNLHEASMSDFLTLLTQCRDFLSDLTAILDALHSIDTDELVVRTEHSVLPDGAATAAAQASQLTALQKLDDLQDALESNALDRLIVRGQDQLFTFLSPLAIMALGAISGPNGYFESTSVPAGQRWVVTSIVAFNATTATTVIRLVNWHNTNLIIVKKETKAFAATEACVWTGHTYLDEDDTIRAYFSGGLGGDTCQIHLTGHRMTVET